MDKPKLIRNQAYISPNRKNFLNSNAEHADVHMTKPTLTRNHKYISPNSIILSRSNADHTDVHMTKPTLTPNTNNLSNSTVDTNNIVSNMIIEISGKKYGLYPLHTPTKRNGGKHRNKTRHTRKH